jgi:hypothetical protein
MEAFKIVLYSLALLTSLGCTVQLYRGYRRRRYPILMWSAMCFAFLTLNNVLLFADLVLFPGLDLRIWRTTTALLAVMCMLYAFLWESD